MKIIKYTSAMLLLVSNQAFSESTYVTIPGEGWSLSLDTPPMTATKSQAEGRLLRYTGSSITTGVTLSVNTEIEASGSHKECFDFYWGKAQKNPMLMKETINTFKNSKAMYATHYSEGEYRGQPFKTANGHAFFVNNGVCIDLHVSHWPREKESDKIVKDILMSLKITK